MNVPKKALVQAWDPADDDEQTIEDPQAYADEFVAIMTEILDREHPLPTKIKQHRLHRELDLGSGRIG